MRIAVGSDHRGYQIKLKVIELIQRLGHEVVDAGPATSHFLPSWTSRTMGITGHSAFKVWPSSSMVKGSPGSR